MIPASDSINTMVGQLQVITDLSGDHFDGYENPILQNLRSKAERMQLFPQSAESMDDWRQVSFRFRLNEFEILVRKYML